MKLIFRRTPVLDASRRENDAEHSWHAALMALVLAEYADKDVNVGRVLAMLLVHDLVEIDAGDTFAYDDEAKRTQNEREVRAAERIFALLPDDQGRRLRGLWDEFEGQCSPDAEFAKAMDRLQPLVQNYFGGGGTWHLPGVSYERVLRRKRYIGRASGTLWRYARSLIEDGVARGWLRRGDGTHRDGASTPEMKSSRHGPPAGQRTH